MNIGSKVVCVDDAFRADIKAIYKQLPVKDNTYTVRQVFLGREKMVKGNETATVGILLEELVNPQDPFHVSFQELGFSAERFREVEEQRSTEYSEAHLVGGKTIETPELVPL